MDTCATINISGADSLLTVGGEGLSLYDSATINLSQGGRMIVGGTLHMEAYPDYGPLGGISIALSTVYCDVAAITAGSLSGSNFSLNIDTTTLEKWVYQTNFILAHTEGSKWGRADFNLTITGYENSTVDWVGNDLVFILEPHTGVLICDDTSGHTGHLGNLSSNRSVSSSLRLRLDADSIFTQDNCDWWTDRTSLVTHAGGVLAWESETATQFALTFGGTEQPSTAQASAISSTAIGGELIFRNFASLTFQNLLAEAGAAINVSGTTDVYITDPEAGTDKKVQFLNNSASEKGGAIYCKDGSVTFLNNGASVLISDNSAGEDGGAIYCEGGSVSFIDNAGSILISNNTAISGGGLYLENSNLTITNNTSIIFAGNTAANGKRESIVQTGADTRVVLSAEAGHTIEFYDGNTFAGAVELGSAAVVAGHTLNPYGDGDAPDTVGAGKVVFSGAAHALYAAAGSKGSELVSSFSNTVKLWSGELQVSDYAKVEVNNVFTAEAGTKTTLGNGILAVRNGSQMKAGSTLAFGWGNAGNSEGTVQSDSQFIATGGGTVKVSGLITARIVVADRLNNADYTDPVGATFVAAMGSTASTSATEANSGLSITYDISHYFAREGNSTIDLSGATYTITLDASFTADITNYFNQLDLVKGDSIRVQIVDSSFVNTAGSTLNFMDSTGSAISGQSFCPDGWVAENNWQTGGYIDFVYIPEPTTATLGILGLASLLLRRRRKA